MIDRQEIILKALKRIGSILSRACVYFTVITLLLYTGGMIVSGIEREWIPTMRMVWMVLAFSIVFEACNQLVLGSKLAAPLKLAIHYLVTAAIFFVVFILWGGYAARPSSALIILLTFTLLYAAAALAITGVRSLLSSARNRREGYESQFADKRDGGNA